MTFNLLLIFVAIYYIRPQNWVPMLDGLRPVLVIMVLAIVSLVFRRRQLQASDFVKTPHDWIYYLFSLYGIIFVPFVDFTHQRPKLFLYMLLTLCLDSVRKLNVFLWVWMGCLVFLSGFALLPLIGIDPADSKDLVAYQFVGRLAINTSNYNNPNALAHSVYPAIMLIYYTMYWRRGPVLRSIAPFLVCLPLLCMWYTESKGAFLCGALTIALGFMFGRSKTVQILVAVLAMSLGVGLVKSLPRMEELHDVRNDPAIWWRIRASQLGMEIMEANPTGIGDRQFMLALGSEIEDNETKASHNSYVQIASEWGYYGFYLFLAILYCNLRVLLTTKTASDDEERVRRLLFVVNLGWMASSWMIDFFPRNEYVMVAGVAAAFHRLMLQRSVPYPREDDTEAMADENEEALLLGRSVSHVGSDHPVIIPELSNVSDAPLLASRQIKTAAPDNSFPASGGYPDFEVVDDNPFSVKKAPTLMPPGPYQPPRKKNPTPEDEFIDPETLPIIGVEPGATDLPGSYDIYTPPKRIGWRRFTWLDIILIILFVQTTLRFWRWTIEKMLEL